MSSRTSRVELAFALLKEPDESAKVVMVTMAEHLQAFRVLAVRRSAQ